MSGQSVRGFVAVLLPDDVRARLAAAAAELRARAPGLAWVRAENLHVTLRFLGEDRKSTRLNSSHIQKSRMPSSA